MGVVYVPGVLQEKLEPMNIEAQIPKPIARDWLSW